MNHTVIGSISRPNGLLTLYDEQYSNKTGSVEILICFSEAAVIYQAYFVCIVLTHDVFNKSASLWHWKQLETM